MRNVIYAINLTLDGCCDHTKGMADDELHAYYARLLREVDRFVCGRITYQLMVPFWPDVARNRSGPTRAINEFAQAFVSVGNMTVFSRTMDEAEGTTRIVRADPPGEVRKLKQEPGRNILVGGVDIPSQLIAHDLIDEYRFVIQPIVVGEGRRLFADLNLEERLQIKLVESKTFQSGCIALRYVRHPSN